MKKWYLFDDCGDIFSQEMNATSPEEAKEELKAAWEKLSTHDRNRRNEFYAIFAEADADGCIDLETGTDIVYL